MVGRQFGFENLWFRVTTRDGSVVDGPVQGNGGLIGANTHHLPLSRRVSLAIAEMRKIVGAGTEGIRLPVFEPKTGCIAMYPAFGINGRGSRVAVPISGATIDLVAQLNGHLARWCQSCCRGLVLTRGYKECPNLKCDYGFSKGSLATLYPNATGELDLAFFLRRRKYCHGEMVWFWSRVADEAELP